MWSIKHLIMDGERPKGATLLAQLLIFVLMYFRMHDIYDAKTNCKVKYDVFLLKNKDIESVVGILVQTCN